MMRLFLLICLCAVQALAQEPTPTPAAAPPVAVPPPAAPTSSSEEGAPAGAPEPVEKAYPIVPMPFPPRPPGTISQDYIGHRFYESKIDSGGWGWIRLPTESWSHARWITLQETPGVAVAPWRYKGGEKGDDQNYEYRLRGYIAPYQVYDPHTDEMLDVFVIEHCELIGPAKPLDKAPGPATRRHPLVPRSTSV